MTKNKTWLGIDLGGTKLLIGEINEKGELLRSKKYPTGPLSQQQALDLMITSTEDFLRTEHPKEEPFPAAMGIGAVGRIDSERGLWMEIEPGRKSEISLAQKMKEEFGIPCYIDNDVRSATKAERLFGFGQNTDNFIYINFGTGVAAGVMTNGQIIRGSHCNAGEVGHTSSGVDFHVPCVCGHDDCVESIASGSGIDKSARILVKEYPDTKLSIPEDGTRVSAAQVLDLCDTDPMCAVLVDHAARGIAKLVMNLVRMADPDTVVLGGGLMSDERLFDKAMAYIDPYTVRFVTNGIVRTKLNPAQIGVIGACSNAILGEMWK